jgi:hypothetical protein
MFWGMTLAIFTMRQIHSKHSTNDASIRLTLAAGIRIALSKQTRPHSQTKAQSNCLWLSFDYKSRVDHEY